MIDAIVDRREMRDYIVKALNFMMNPDITSESTAQLSGLKFQVNA
jgi:acetyl-CoA carboxylase beta subunit